VPKRVVVRAELGHGDGEGVVAGPGVGEIPLDAEGEEESPVAVLRMGTTAPVVGSSRPYFGFTVISADESALWSHVLKIGCDC
jgi:hypothetical protein